MSSSIFDIEHCTKGEKEIVFPLYNLFLNNTHRTHIHTHTHTHIYIV